MRSHIRRLGATMGVTALLSVGALAAAGTASAAATPMAGGWSSHHRHHKEFECHFVHLGKWGGAFALVCHEEGHHHHHH